LFLNKRITSNTSPIEQARQQLAKGIGLWSWVPANDDRAEERMNPSGDGSAPADIPTKEVLAAVEILHREIPTPEDPGAETCQCCPSAADEHPHGLSDRDFRQPVHHRQAVILQLPRLIRG